LEKPSTWRSTLQWEEGVIVSIAGSRNYPHPDEVRDFVQRLAEYPDAMVVSGGRGIVDLTAERTAREEGLNVISYRPREVNPTHFEIVTYAYGDRAEELVDANGRRWSSPIFAAFDPCAYFRNGWVVGDSERLVAFHDGVSKGTANAIELAKGLRPVSLKRPGLPMVTLD
jgi:hypothetical protein